MSVIDFVEKYLEEYKDLAADGAEKAGELLGSKLVDLVKAQVEASNNTWDNEIALNFLSGVRKGIDSELGSAVTAPADTAAQ